MVQNWSTLQCSKQNTEQCGYDHAPVTRGRMRTQFPLPHGPPFGLNGDTILSPFEIGVIMLYDTPEPRQQWGHEINVCQEFICGTKNWFL